MTIPTLAPPRIALSPAGAGAALVRPGGGAMMDRRTALAALAAAVALPAGAQAPAGWPNRPIRIVTPTPPGVGSDNFARVYADKLSTALGVSVVVENKPGAGSTLGTDAVAKAPPDGYTLLFATSTPFTISPYIFPRVPYTLADLQPVIQAARGGSFIVGSPALPAKSLPELVAAAKAKPKAISYASYGNGSTAHIGFELLQDAADIELLHVPYRQGALPDVIGGQVMLGFEPAVSAIPNIRSGRVKALAYTGEKRSTALPEVPTLAELYNGLTVISWLGFWVPAKTPPAIVQALNKAVADINRTPEMQKYIADAGVAPSATTPDETLALLKREAAAMEKLIKAKGIRQE